MNEFLAGIYNTRQAIGAGQDTSDVEKLAEAQLLDEALRAEGVDIDKLPGETILKLAHQLLGEDSALVKAAEAEAFAGKETPAEEKKEEEEEAKGEEEVKQAAIAELRAKTSAAKTAPAAAAAEGDETFEEKVAQADFLGRVMAHSYWNEKTAIEKNAGIKDIAGKAFGAAKSGGGKAWEAAKGGAGKAKDWAKAHPKTSIGVGAGAAAAGGTAAAMAGKKKKASAIDVLAEKRAMEWAQAHGLLEQSDEEKLAAVVNQRAVELLAEQGIDVAAVEAAAQK